MQVRGKTLLQRMRGVKTLRVACALLTLWPAMLFSADGVSEQELKAAVLFRAAKFIEWPASAFSDSRSPFVICLVGDKSALAAFESIRNKQINAHSVNVRQVTGDMLDLGQCHIAFFTSLSNADVNYALGKFQGMPVLTVGETESFARRGGMFALTTREQRVQFTVNLPATKRAGLIVSSQLLQLATVIDNVNR